MISLKLVCEFCNINCKFSLTVVYLLPKNYLKLRKLVHLKFMAENLHNAIKSMSLVDDDPIILPDEPEFRVFAENENSLMGWLLNPD